MCYSVIGLFKLSVDGVFVPCNGYLEQSLELGKHANLQTTMAPAVSLSTLHQSSRDCLGESTVHLLSIWFHRGKAALK